MSTLQLEITSPGELGPAERAAWSAWTAADTACDSPYFHLRYIEVAFEVAPHPGMAVIRREGELVGFLPFQRRGGELQPLGAPLSDYHGPILKPGVQIDLAEIARQLGSEVLSFTGLAQPGLHTGPAIVRHRMTADLSHGYEDYMAKRCAAHSRFFQTRRRHDKGLVRDHGAYDFSYGRDPADALDWIIDNKRRQYRRTGQHDIFACGWTANLLRRLAAEASEDFGPRFSVMRIGGEIVSAVTSLAAGERSHLWFPAYNHAYARYGPGMLTTMKMLEAASAEGCQAFDFGPGEELYKTYFSDPARPVVEGRLIANPGRVSLSRALSEGMGGRLRRRLHVVSACETSLAGWTRGLATVARAAARLKHRAALLLLAAPPALLDFAEVLPVV